MKWKIEHIQHTETDLMRLCPAFSPDSLYFDAQMWFMSECVSFHSNNTLWGSLEEPDIVSTNEFEDLFSKATLQPKKKPLSDTYEKKTKAKKVQ